MAANKGLGFIWSELSTPGRTNLPSAGPVTPGFNRNFRSAWGDGATPSRVPAGPGVVPGGLQAFLGTPEDKKPQGWKLDRSQQFGFRTALPGANPAPPRPMEPKGTPAPPAPPRPKAPVKAEVPPPGVGPRATNRLNQLMDYSQRQMDRLLNEGNPGPTARQLLEARLAKSRLARSQADEAARAEKLKQAANSPPVVKVRVQAQVERPKAAPAKEVEKARPSPAPAPLGSPSAVDSPRDAAKAEVARRDAARREAARAEASTPETARPDVSKPVPKPADGEPWSGAEPKTATEPKPAGEPKAAGELKSEPKSGTSEPKPAASEQKPAAEPRPEPKPGAAEAKPAEARAEGQSAAQPKPGGDAARAPSPRPEPVRPAASDSLPPRPATVFGSVLETPSLSPKPESPPNQASQQQVRPRSQVVDRTAPPREAPTATPRQERPESRSVDPVDAQARRQPTARHLPPPVEVRRERPPVEAPHHLKESEAALEERAVRTRPSELIPIPEQPRRVIQQEEPFKKNVRETGRSHQEPEEHGHEEPEDEEGQGERGKGRAKKDEGPERKRSSTDPKEQQQQARRLTQTRESFQMALRKLETMQQTRAGESVAVRNAAQAIGALLKKAYREQELQDLDEESAVNALGLLLKLGGEETYNHSARVLDLAMGLADEIGADLQTKKQTRQGALLKDLGDVGQVYGGMGDGALDELGGFLSRQDLRKASLLQDIGMLQVPRELLAQTGRLTVDELELIRRHPVYGAEMVRPIASLRHLSPVIRGHHERWDGQGYPDGLKAEQIPLPARIIAIADAYDALRQHKAGLGSAEAWEILCEGEGTHFDPWLLAAFGRSLRRR